MKMQAKIGTELASELSYLCIKTFSSINVYPSKITENINGKIRIRKAGVDRIKLLKIRILTLHLARDLGKRASANRKNSGVIVA